MFIDQNGKTWYKGNLHTHTTVTDGKKTPGEVIALYREHGYDFLSLTDHWVHSETRMTEDGMLLLGGCEYNINGADVLAGVFHIVAVGEREPARLERSKANGEYTAQDIVDAIHDVGGIAILAHPAWSLETCEQIMPLEGFDGIEIYNSVSGLPRNCRPYSGEVIDQLAVRGRVFPSMCADDSHFYQSEACLSYIYVQADELSGEAILDAIRAGRVMATQGPRFCVTVENIEGSENRLVRYTCDPVSQIVFYTGSVWHDGRSISGEGLRGAEFILRPFDRFVRAEFIDENGRIGFDTPILYR